MLTPRLIAIAILCLQLPAAVRAGEAGAVANVEALLQKAPVVAELELEYRAVPGLAGRSAWHIGKSAFWIRLHPAERFDMEQLDKDRIYKVKGIVLEQAYGTVNFWVQALRPLSPNQTTR